MDNVKFMRDFSADYVKIVIFVPVNKDFRYG